MAYVTQRPKPKGSKYLPFTDFRAHNRKDSCTYFFGLPISTVSTHVALNLPHITPEPFKGALYFPLKEPDFPRL